MARKVKNKYIIWKRDYKVMTNLSPNVTLITLHVNINELTAPIKNKGCQTG